MPRDINLDQRIIAYLSAHPGTYPKLLAEGLGKPANTVGTHVKKLIKAKVIEEGLRVAPAYTKRLFKSYIFIYTQYRGQALGSGEEINYQQQLVQSIHDKLGIEPYSLSLYLESVEIVMGAEFDVILILSALDIGPIGLFVTNFLRPHRDVQKTQTITVWPTKTKLNGGDDKTASEIEEQDEEAEEHEEDPPSV